MDQPVAILVQAGGGEDLIRGDRSKKLASGKRAIELLESWEHYETGCPDEEQFNEVYLRTREEQEAIRNANPNSNHCDLLLHDNRACVGCKKNPNEGRNETVADIVTRNSDSLEWLLGLARSVRRGLIRPDGLDAKSNSLIQIAIDYLEREQDKRLAKLIGYEVAEVIIKAFHGTR